MEVVTRRDGSALRNDDEKKKRSKREEKKIPARRKDFSAWSQQAKQPGSPSTLLRRQKRITRWL